MLIILNALSDIDSIESSEVISKQRLFFFLNRGFSFSLVKNKKNKLKKKVLLKILRDCMEKDDSNYFYYAETNLSPSTL